MTLEFSDLDTIKETALRRFDERIVRARDDHKTIEQEAAKLETQLEQLFSLTALMARREPDVAKTAELWSSLVKTCDLFAGKVFQLSQQYALATSVYDNILDIRSSAQELRALHSP